MSNLSGKKVSLVVQAEDFDGMAQFALPATEKLVESLLHPRRELSREDAESSLDLLRDLLFGADLACEAMPTPNWPHQGWQSDHFEGQIFQQGQLLDVYTRNTPLGEVVLLRFGAGPHDYVAVPLEPTPLLGNAQRMIEFRRASGTL